MASIGRIDGLSTLFQGNSVVVIGECGERVESHMGDIALALDNLGLRLREQDLRDIPWGDILDLPRTPADTTLVLAHFDTAPQNMQDMAIDTIIRGTQASTILLLDGKVDPSRLQTIQSQMPGARILTLAWDN